MLNNVNYALYVHDCRFNTNSWAKISLDKRLRTRYNELIKNEIGGQPNPFALTEKRDGLKKALDKEFNLGYNESIKNGIGN